MAQQVKQGNVLIIRSAYSVRGFMLEPNEQVPQDPREFDKTSHQSRLVQLSKAERCVVLGATLDGQVLARVEREGASFACFLLADSFDVSDKPRA